MLVAWRVHLISFTWKLLSESFAMIDLRHRPLMSMSGLATKVQLGHLFFFPVWVLVTKKNCRPP